MADEKLSRKMIFPYTFTAKVAQFPFKLHFKHHWMFPWFFAATVVISPVFYQIQKAGNKIYLDLYYIRIKPSVLHFFFFLSFS